MVKARPYIYSDSDSIPLVDAVLIPGASVYRSGDLSPVLKERVEVGIRYIFDKDSVKILFSGHSVPYGYNEPVAMAEFAKKRLVPPEKIIQDSNGTSTYFSLLNCKKKFNFSSILIITQEYHLPRSIFIAHDLGLNAYGLITPSNYHRSSGKVALREFFSRLKAFFLLKFFKLFQS
jgi:SanA protein